MDMLDILFKAEPEQRTEAWHAQRLGRFTSSRFGDLMTSINKPIEQAKTAMNYVVECAVEAVLSERKEFSSAATEHGNNFEDEAIEVYQKKENCIVSSASFKKKGTHAGGSPDGYVGIDGLIEVKCPFNPFNHATTVLTNEVPKQYVWQVQGNLWVTGRDWCDFISYHPMFPEASQLVVIRVYPNEEMIDSLVKRLDEAEELKQALIQKMLGND